MRPLLILDTYLEQAGGAPEFRALIGERASEAIRPPFGDAVPKSSRDHAGLLLTGSAASVTDSTLEWLEPIRDLVRDAIDRAQPVLGICFGHQLIAQAALGNDAVRVSPTPELGWREIEVFAEHPLLAGLDRRFECFVSHFDEVWIPEGGLEVFARSERCAVHGYQVPDRPVFGLQFHPELTPEECRRIVRRNLQRVAPEADPEREIARQVDGRPLGRRIMSSFFKLTGA